MPIYADLIKGQDEEAYKKHASKGMDLIFPVSIEGQTHRPDIGVIYHNSVKIFDPQKDNKEQVHQKASSLDLTPPNPREVGIEPTIITGRDGYKMHVLRMHGPHAEKIKTHNESFAGHGFQQNYEFHPHITVDKPTWDRIRSSGAKNAQDAGIKFHGAELRHGNAILQRYHPGELKKGLMTNVGTALGVAAAVASTPVNKEPSFTSHPAPILQMQPKPYSQKRMLNAIASVESQHGKLENHKPLGGIHHGESAVGKYALTPNVIRETWHLNRNLQRKYPKAKSLRGDDMRRYVQDNPGMEDAFAQSHLNRLEHHFGQNVDNISMAWLNGIRGTNKAIKNKQDIANHWHVKKVRSAYDTEK